MIANRTNIKNDELRFVKQRLLSTVWGMGCLLIGSHEMTGLSRAQSKNVASHSFCLGVCLLWHDLKTQLCRKWLLQV